MPDPTKVATKAADKVFSSADLIRIRTMLSQFLETPLYRMVTGTVAELLE